MQARAFYGFQMAIENIHSGVQLVVTRMIVSDLCRAHYREQKLWGSRNVQPTT